MDLWLIITIVLVAAIVGVALFVARGRPEVERPGKLPPRPAPQPPKTFPKASPEGPKAPTPIPVEPVPPPAPPEPEPPAEPNGKPEKPGHGHAHGHALDDNPPPPIVGEETPWRQANDKVGDPALARRVSLLRSTNKLLPDDKLFKPGDVCTLRAQIVDESSKPLEGVPVFWRLHAQRRDLTPAYLTDNLGYAEAQYTVTEEDMVVGGSYIVMCYAGGRALLQKALLHDVVQ